MQAPHPLSHHDSAGAEGVEAVFHVHNVSKIYTMGEVAGALFRRGEGWSVFAIENGRARTRDVEVGHRNAIQAEVMRGLTEGTEVILHPGNQVAEGRRISH